MVGDFRGLARLQKQLEGLARDGMAEVSKQLAAEAQTQTLIGFELGVDPYDRPWMPLKRPRARGPGLPLRDTGKLMASYHAEPTPTGFVLSAASYGEFHQRGTKHLRKRMQFPERTMGRRWGKALSDAARAVRRRRMGK